MANYLLIYIDEQQEERDAFELYFDNYDEFEVKFIEPGGKSVSQIVEEILGINPHMVILDFNLKYADTTVQDNGDVLMQRITDRKPLLPVAILTSYIEDAQHGFLSPERRNSILIKSKLNDPSDPELSTEIKSYISYHNDLLNKYKTELAELTLKDAKSPEDQARITELDMILEEEVDRQSSIKAEHKTDQKLDELTQLITATKDLLNKFNDDQNA